MEWEGWSLEESVRRGWEREGYRVTLVGGSKYIVMSKLLAERGGRPEGDLVRVLMMERSCKRARGGGSVDG